MKVRSTLFLGLAAAALAAPAASHAGVISRADAGPDPASVTDTRDAIRGDLGTFTNIAWDGVNDAQSAPNEMPPDRFLGGNGVIFGPATTKFEVSNPDTNPDPNQQRFGPVNAAYLTEFRTFSGDQLFRAKDTTVTDVDFFVNGQSGQKATTNGFGVVFADVDLPNTTKVEAFDVTGKRIGVAFAPPADKGLSIASVVADDGATIAKVRITSGNLPLGAGAVDSATNDVVAMDDFIIGTTVAASDLTVAVTDAPDPVVAGENLVYTATVTNNGPGAAPAAKLNWSVPNGAAQISATPSQGNCPTVSTCELGSLAAGASATLTLTVKPTAAGSIKASFWTTSANDVTPANDAVDVTTTVDAAAPGDTKAPKVVISPKAVTIAANGNATFAIACPKDEKTCKGAIRLTSAKALRIGGLKLRLDLGSGRFSVAGGKTAQVTIRIGAAERTLLKALGQIQVKVDVAVSDAAGNDATASRNVVLKARK
jgi:uncharacterized repeat protein (TIGR01451 family)